MSAGAWEMFAACVGKAALFDDETAANVEKAKAVCAGCPVSTECLEGALDREEPWGVWGGVTTKERAPMVKLRRSTAAASTG